MNTLFRLLAHGFRSKNGSIGTLFARLIALAIMIGMGVLAIAQARQGLQRTADAQDGLAPSAASADNPLRSGPAFEAPQVDLAPRQLTPPIDAIASNNVAPATHEELVGRYAPAAIAAATGGRYGAEPTDDTNAQSYVSDPGRTAAAVDPPAHLGSDARSLEPPRADAPYDPRQPAPQEVYPPREPVLPAPSQIAPPQPVAPPQPAVAVNDAAAFAPPAANSLRGSFAGAADRVASAADRIAGLPAPPPAGAGTGQPGGRQLEGVQAPSLTIEKRSPEEIQVGRECIMEVMVRNVGQTPADGVFIRDEIPKGTTLVSTSPRAETSADGALLWKLGSLGPGEETRVEIRLMPVAEGEIGSVATASFEARATARSRCTRPQLAIRVTAPAQVMIGEDVLIGIEVSNPGTGVATGVMLQENVPPGLSHPSGAALEFEVGTLAPGESREMELLLTAEQAGMISNPVLARGEANLEANDTAQFEVIAPALAVAVDGPTRRYLERQATYTFSVTNPGTAAAREIELIGYLPRGMKFVKANNSGQYDAATHSVSWGLEELPSRQRGSVELVALPVQPGEHKLRVEGRAEQGLADEAEQQVLVEGVAAILFEVADVDDPVEIGGETSYEIRVVNQGSKASNNVRVVAFLPPGMKALSATGPTQHAIEEGRVLFAPLGRLAPKADTTFRVNVQAFQAGDQRLRVQIVTDEMQTPVTEEESTRVYADE